MKRWLVFALALVPTVASADPAAEARQVVADWLAAQNRGDFAKYAASYDAGFVGIRRTANGGEKRMKLKAWSADRKKMFKRPQQVVGDGLTLTVNGGVVTVRMLQRWKGGGYADHGTKVLRLAHDRAGAMKIVHEELLSSTPGWDDDPGKVLDATGLASPITARLRAEGIERGAGCPHVTWVLFLQDKTKTLQREIGRTDMMLDDDDTSTTLRAEPGDATDLFEVGEWCAGGQTVFTVKRSGDALVVVATSNEECPSDEPDCDPDFTETILTVNLPEGAKVRPAR